MTEQYKILSRTDVQLRPRAIETSFWQGALDVTYPLLKKEGFEVISMDEEAVLRVDKNRISCMEDENLTRGGMISVPEKGVFLVRKSPVFYDLAKARELTMKGERYWLNSDEVEKALVDSFEIPNNLIEWTGNLGRLRIPLRELGNDALAVYCFGTTYGKYSKQDSRDAQAYGQLILNAGHGNNELFVCMPSFRDKAFATIVEMYNS